MVVVNTLVETSREPKVRSELRKHNKYTHLELHLKREITVGRYQPPDIQSPPRDWRVRYLL